ncbi:hypothetical protein MN608_11095 [Microdochium nivale]|nr:hypothetical protein MN608_11095 [Microdochium nivale]
MLEHYANRIKPALEVLLQDLDSDHVDILVHPYMIGRTRETAQPFVFICCTDLIVLRRAEQQLRASNLLASNPPFKLGTSALPLGANAPLRGIAGLANEFEHPEAQLSQETISTARQKRLTREKSQNKTTGIFVRCKVRGAVRSSKVYHRYANQTTTRVGARLACRNAHEGSPVGSIATGGVILCGGGNHFQLIARHLWDNVNFSIHKPLLCDDLDYCHFDGEDDEDDSELETGSQASLSECSSASSQCDTEFSVALGDLTLTPKADTESTCSTNGACQRINEKHIAQSPATEANGIKDTETTLSVSIGFFRVRNTNIPSRTLDYSLVHLFSNAHLQFADLNKVTVGNRTITIRTINHIPATDTEIIAVTGSSGACAGMLSPSPVLHSVGGCIMTLYQVLLHRDHVRHGDSGSAIIDAATGAYYGHLVLGSPGGRLAYLLSGKDVLADIQRQQAMHVSLSASRPVPVSVIRRRPMSALFAWNHAAENPGSSTAVRPWLVRLASVRTLMKSAVLLAPGAAVQQTTRIKLEIQGDLLLMSQGWTSEERTQARRVVKFTMSRIDSTLGLAFAPVTTGQLGPGDLCTSCIYWQEQGDFFVTGADVIHLLGRLFAAPARFSLEDKNYIRRKLQGYRPIIVAPERADTQGVFDLVVGLSRPRPVYRRETFNLIPWRLLPLILDKMLAKYVRVSPTRGWQSLVGASGPPPVLPALQPTQLVGGGDATGNPLSSGKISRLPSKNTLATRPSFRLLPEPVCSSGDADTARNRSKSLKLVKSDSARLFSQRQ